jgi:3'-phosphoadenosine 5'-phosphosulfate sulfotransferase (PAPS reductase)/FAD synthetase
MLNLAESLTLITQKRPNFSVIFTTSLGQEDQVITDVVFGNNLDIAVVTLDTGRLFQETYSLIDNTRAKYKTDIPHGKIIFCLNCNFRIKRFQNRRQTLGSRHGKTKTTRVFLKTNQTKLSIQKKEYRF